MPDQPPVEVRLYPTHECAYVLRRFIVTAEDGTTYPSLVSIPQRMFVRPDGKVYTGPKRAEFDQPVQPDPRNVISGPDGRKIPQQAWQPMATLWQDFPVRVENAAPLPTPELAPQEPAAATE